MRPLTRPNMAVIGNKSQPGVLVPRGERKESACVMRRRLITLLMAPFAAALLVLPLTAAPAAADLVIHVNKSTQRMTVSRDGQFLYEWPVSTGRPSLPTPSGTFRPFRMDIDHVSEQYDNAPMPYSIFFTRHGDAIHGTDEVKYIGRAVSHGCVRLTRKHAAILWKLVKQEKMANTRVVLTGRVPGRTPLVAEGPDRETTGQGARYERRWSNGRVYYEDNGRYYYDDRPPPPPPDYVPERRYYRAGGPYDDRDPPPPAPFPFFLFGQ
jgi:hypothetical protein